MLARALVAETAAALVEVAADLHGEVPAAGCVEARVLLAVAEAAAVAELAVAGLLESEALRANGTPSVLSLLKPAVCVLGGAIC